MPFFAALGLLLIGLKLAEVIHWSWWIILLPVYGPTMVFVAIALAVFFGFRKLAYR